MVNSALVDTDTYDVIIIGGSLAGSATATLLLREHPHLRVCIAERAPSFTRRVGEATVEISGYFLGRVLGLSHHLNEAHLVKQGMRFWFANAETQTLADASEIGPQYHVRLPSWQLDRSVVDEKSLEQAVDLGAELRRPAQVREATLAAGGEQVVRVTEAGAEKLLRGRWIVDASGVAALLARQEGWFQANTAHPTAAAWARWRGVKDWDGRTLGTKFPDWSARCVGSRNTATNHIVGDGWWSWWIPLKGGDVSVGVVFDQRLVRFPQGEAKLGDRIRDFLSGHPVAAELLAEAEWVEGDVHWRKNLAYTSRQFAGDGFALVGDAAAFLDPLYSPGLDGVAFTVTATTQLIAAHFRGEPVEEALAQHNARFTRSYARWFEAVYKDKYEYIGDYELMGLGFYMDLGLYYLGVVSQPFKFGEKALALPPFIDKESVPVFHLMRSYNRRLARMAQVRRERGVFGRANSNHHFLVPSFSLDRSDVPRIVKAAARWLLLEVKEGWRSWFRDGESGAVNEARPGATTLAAAEQTLPQATPSV